MLVSQNQIIDAYSGVGHNALFRGKDLTDYFNSGEMSKAIANGAFKNIYIGDYINKPIMVDDTTYNVKWEVADLDYFLHDGDTETTAHHIVMLPSVTIQTNISMNDTDTTEGGYLGSKMWTNVIPKYAAAIKAAFGADHVLSHRELLTNAVNTPATSAAGANFVGTSINWTWVDVDANIPSEPMIYGGTVFGSSGYDVGDKEHQLQLFRFKKFNAGRKWFWLQAVASASRFCIADDYGNATFVDASHSSQWGGIRPYFLLR